MSEHFVTVIVPCFNGERFLSRTLDSVLWQTHGLWECIVVDDGSTDRTAEIIQSYILKDPRFKVHHKKNGGLASARNAGIALAQGEFIQLLDADDVLLPNRLERCLRYIDSSPDSRAVYSDYTLFTNRDGFFKILPGRIPGDDQLRAFLFEFNRTFIIPIHAYLFRTTLIKEYLFDESLHSYAEDNDFRIRLALAGIRFDFIDEILVVYRMNDAQVTSSHEAKIFSNMLQALKNFQRLPACAQYEVQFREQFRYLHQRIVIGHFMRKEFRTGFDLMRTERMDLTFGAVMKILLWAILMLFISKDTVAGIRTRIGGMLKMRTNGWEMKKDWIPPQALYEHMLP
ncbi:MAG: glycosyltransferase family 2 protein [Bacteroidota bacterium]